MVYNHRRDRPQRGTAFCSWLLRSVQEFGTQQLILTGQGTRPIFQKLLRLGYPPERLHRQETVSDAQPFMETVLASLPTHAVKTSTGQQPVATLVGVGNWAGAARVLGAYWERIGERHA